MYGGAAGNDFERQLLNALLRARNWRDIGYALAEHLKVIVPFDRLTFTLVDPTTGLAEVLVAEGEIEGLTRTGERIPLEGTATGWVVQHRAPLVETEANYQTAQFELALRAGFRSRLAVPVEVDGRIVAVLVFHSRSPSAYALEHADRLRPLMLLVASALQRLSERWELEQALSQERTMRERLELLRRLDTLLLSDMPMPQVLQGFAKALRPFVPFDRLSLSIYNETTNREWLFVVWHDTATWDAREVSPMAPFGAAKQVMRTGQPLLRPHLDAAEFPAEAWLRERGFRSALVYPLPMREHFKATLNFSSRTPNRFTNEHIAFLNEIAEQVALALHALLSEAVEREHNENVRRLLQASVDLLAAHTVDDIVRVINRSLKALGIPPQVAIFVRFPDGVVRQAAETPEGLMWFVPHWLPQPIQPGATVMGDILLGRLPLFVTNDPINDTWGAEQQEWKRQLGDKAIKFGNAVVPMQGYTRIIGAIAVDFRESQRLISPQDELVQTLVTLANLAGLALENVWLRERMEQQLKETQILNDLIIHVTAGADWRHIAHKLVEQLPQVLPCDTASVSLLTEDGQHLEFVATYPAPPPGFPLGVRVPVTVGIMGYVVRTGEPVLERDVRTNPHYFAGRPETLSELCVPIRVGQKVVGVINLESRRLGAFTDAHLAFLQTLAAQLGTVMERAQLLQRQTELTQQLSAIFESVQEGIALVLTDGRLDDVNERFGELVGMPAAQLRNQPVDVLRTALLRRAADPTALQAALDATLNDFTQPHTDALFLTDPERIVERYCVPVWLPDGTLMGQLWVLRDVTEERRRQQEALRVERLRTLGELASGIAHDLNNALAPLLGSAELLRQHTDPEIRDLAETMLHATEHAIGIARRLQSFYRATAASAHLPLNLNELVQDAIALTRPRWHDEALMEGVRILVETHFAEGLSVRGDAAELRQAFINILLNAVDAILERAKVTGRREGTITIATAREGNLAVVRITDDGIGMTEEVQRRAFEAFFTTKGERGSGLGLSTALATVLVHGGRIYLKSAPLRGTTVTVTLPSQQETAVAADPAEHPVEAPLPHWRILVVEDQAPVLQTVVLQLRRLGQEVLTATDGIEAWEILSKEPVDLLVTDLSMPRMNGLELTRRVHERFPHLPTVLMTGWGEAFREDELAALGIRAVLNKPVTLAAWQSLLRRLVSDNIHDGTTARR